MRISLFCYENNLGFVCEDHSLHQTFCSACHPDQANHFAQLIHIQDEVLRVVTQSFRTLGVIKLCEDKNYMFVQSGQCNTIFPDCDSNKLLCKDKLESLSNMDTEVTDPIIYLLSINGQKFQQG